MHVLLGDIISTLDLTFLSLSFCVYPVQDREGRLSNNYGTGDSGPAQIVVTLCRISPFLLFNSVKHVL